MTHLAFRALARLGYRMLVRFERDLDGSVAAIAPRVPVTYTWLTRAEADIEAHVRMNPGDPARDVAARLSRGDVCLAAEYEGRLVAAAWAAFASPQFSGFLGRAIPIGEREVYVHYVFTRPDMRGRAIQSSLLARLCADAHARGCRRALALVMPGNAPSRRCFERVGFRRTGILTGVHLPWHRDGETP